MYNTYKLVSSNNLGGAYYEKLLKKKIRIFTYFGY